MWPDLQENADLVTFTEEILDGKLHFLCSVSDINLLNKSLQTMLTLALNKTLPHILLKINNLSLNVDLSRVFRIQLDSLEFF